MSRPEVIMGNFDETIHVTEERMICASNADDPITDVALAVQKHYLCPWRAAEDIAIRVRNIMREQGWTVTRPNLHAVAGLSDGPKRLGDFNIPLTGREVLFQLSNGTPIQIGRSFLEKALLMIRIHCSNSEIDVQTDHDHAYLTPRKCELNALGRKKIEEED